jgi:hypothetical protein
MLFGRLRKVIRFLCVVRHIGSGQIHERAAEYLGRRITASRNTRFEILVAAMRSGFCGRSSMRKGNAW